MAATADGTGFATNMSGNATLTVAASPTIFNVTGGGSYTQGGNGVLVGLDGSQSGINYQLELNGNNLGSPVAGMGSAISFGNQTAAGTCTVVATTDGTDCTANMSGSAIITVSPLPAFLEWQSQHFGCTNCPQAAATADPDGDGQNNFAEFLAGTDPASGASVFRIISIARTNNNLRITWNMGAGKTNALQRTAGGPGGRYSTNTFTDIFTVTNTVGSVTNCLDIGATNFPARYYRVRLVP